MCRLFGLLSSPATPAEPWLVSTDRSLLRQSQASEKTAQRDGWGIGWYRATRTPRLEKGIGGAFEPGERERFMAAAARATSPMVIAHLRAASNPMRLRRERLIALENVQPFTHEGDLFAHNGSIPFPRETRPLLGKYERKVMGVNDSEVLFWLFVRHLEEQVDPLGAYAQTVDDLVHVWRNQGSPKGGPFDGLNVLFSRGPNELWAFCHWRGEHGPRFFDDRPYYQMTYVADPKQVMIGSEPFDSHRADWMTLANGTYLCAQSSHGLVASRMGPIPLAAPIATA
ncbi:MAG: class II glutamine amidotransferase [Thermoplasmata archaeon]|nr:class II glutamine amidotransferase [Thermoplasmata archaeon]